MDKREDGKNKKTEFKLLNYIKMSVLDQGDKKIRENKIKWKKKKGDAFQSSIDLRL